MVKLDVKRDIKIDVMGGGTFSKFMQALNNLIQIPHNNFYLNISDERFIDNNENLFDEIFKQKLGNSAVTIKAKNFGDFSSINPIEKSINFKKLRVITKNLIFQKDITSDTSYLQKKLKIKSNTVGIHIRLTDMNILHGGDYGIFTFDHYLREINSLNHMGNFFIASDNHESILKLKNIFGDRISYISDYLRADYETDNTFDLQLEKPLQKRLWVESFKEMLLLSKCNILICRTSNLSNAAIIYGNFKRVIRIDKTLYQKVKKYNLKLKRIFDF